MGGSQGVLPEAGTAKPRELTRLYGNEARDGAHRAPDPYETQEWSATNTMNDLPPLPGEEHLQPQKQKPITFASFTDNPLSTVSYLCSSQANCCSQEILDSVEAQCRPLIGDCEEVSHVTDVHDKDLHGEGLDENGEFRVMLDRTRGVPLGIDIIYWEDNTLLVEAVIGGLVQDWNRRHPKLRVRRGDVVVEVNGVMGDMHRLVDECTKNNVLWMTLRRPKVLVRSMETNTLPPS